MLHSRLLTYLDQVARSGSIRKAATKLNVASSAVNRQILAIERDLGTPLFTRLHKRLRLTAAGEIILGHVRDTLKNYDKALTQVDNLKGLRHGEVIIATMHTIASELLPLVVQSFHTRYPGVDISIRVTSGIGEAVLAEEADLGVGFNLAPEAGLREYASAPMGFGAVVHPNHPMASRKTATIRGAAGYPLLLHDRGMSIRPALDRALSQIKTDTKIVTTTNSIDFMKRSARSGLGVAFLTRLDVREELARRELVYIPLTDLPTSPYRLSIICRSNVVLSGVAGLMAEELRKAVELLLDLENETTSVPP